MGTHRLFTKRWWFFFALMFIIWYPVSVMLVTFYQVGGNPYVFIGLNMFTPLWFLFMSYMYFRKARNDWTARFATAFGWVALMFVFAALLVQPVYGYPWTSIINVDVLLANWINIVAVLVAGVASKKPQAIEFSPIDKVQDVIKNGPKGR